MVGFPKALKTKEDLVNTFNLAKNGELNKDDWLEAVGRLENQNYISCPIVAMSDNRKTVTIMFCSEAENASKAKTGTGETGITGVEHVDIAADDNADSPQSAENGMTQNKSQYTLITFTKAINANLDTVGIPAAVTFYDTLNITKSEVEKMKGELAQYEQTTYL